MSLPTFYTPAELAKILKVSSRTVYEHLRSGRLKGSRVGDTWRVSEESVRESLEAAPDKARQLLLAVASARKASREPAIRSAFELLEWFLSQNARRDAQAKTVENLIPWLCRQLPPKRHAELRAAAEKFLAESKTRERRSR